MEFEVVKIHCGSLIWLLWEKFSPGEFMLNFYFVFQQKVFLLNEDMLFFKWNFNNLIFLKPWEYKILNKCYQIIIRKVQKCCKRSRESVTN